MRLLTALPLALLILSACVEDPTEPSNPANETFGAALSVDLTKMTKVSSDLYTQDLVVGTGAAATNGKTLRVIYTGYFVSGTTFDSNVGKSAFSFVLGAGGVIPGWDQGLVGLKEGGTRRLVIGSALAYGASGQGPIPPNTTLVFNVQLLTVQ